MENKKEDWVFSECKEYGIEYLDQVNSNPSIHLAKFSNDEISGTKIKYDGKYIMTTMLPYGLEKLWEKNIRCARKL